MLSIWSQPGVEAVFRVSIGPVTKRFRAIFEKDGIELKQSEKKLLQTKERLREKDIIIEKLKGKIHH